MSKHASSVSPKLTECPVHTGLFFVDKVSGETRAVPCSRYDCDYCGPRKVFRLKCALIDAFQGKSLRLFTFTFTNRFHVDPAAHYDVMRRAWHSFLRDLRRHPDFTAHQRKVAFFRVTEQHKSGYTHFHVVFTAFLPVQTIQAIWEKSLVSVMKFQPFNHFANVDVSTFRPPRAARGVSKSDNFNKHAVGYVLKYLVKSFAVGKDLSNLVSVEVVGDDVLQRETEASSKSRLFARKMRRYSKSNSLVLFPVDKDREKKCVVVSYSKGRFRQLHTNVYLDDLGITAQSHPVLIGSSWHLPGNFHPKSQNSKRSTL